MTTIQPKMVLQSRNDVRFRSYQKFGAELKVVDEVGEDDEPTRETKSPAKPKIDKPAPATQSTDTPPTDKPSDGAPPIPTLKPKKPTL
jgi:BRCT domain type II-containing protein